MLQNARSSLVLALLTAAATAAAAHAQAPAGGRPGSEDPGRELRERILQRYDQDKDGQLSEQERAAVRKDIQEGKLPVPPAVRERLLGRPGGRPGWERLAEKLNLERDVEYAKAGDVSLKLDIAYPKQTPEKPLAAIVFIHGGGWQGGDKAGGFGPLASFAESGHYVCATINYRLSDVATWPAQIHDCKAAIRFLKANAARYHLDPERVGVWGSSAGGHLVSLLGTSGGVKELEGTLGPAEPSSRVTCVVDFCGPSDFSQIKVSPGAAGPVAKLLGGPVDQKQAEAKAASPVTYVSKDDPPFLIVHGTEDPLVPLAQAEILGDALKKAGADVTLVKVEGAGHGLGGPKVLERVTAFLDKHLLGKDVSVSADPIPAR